MDGVRLGGGATPSGATDSMTEDTEGARALKRPRLVWTASLHKRFEEALLKLGPEKAIPKNIMQEMNVEGLTRENVASHLQKYRLQRGGGDGKFGSDGASEEHGGHTQGTANPSQAGHRRSSQEYVL